MPTNKTGFDASPFTRELGRVFGEYRQYNTRSSALLLHQLGAKLQVDLAQAAADLRPSQQAKIEAVPQQQNYQVKRRLAQGVGNERTATATFKKGKKKGQFKSQSIVSRIRRESRGQKHVSIEQEIKLRKRFAAYFQASGWLSPRLKNRPGIRMMVPPCVVIEELDGTDLSVTLENPRPGSADFASQYLEAAFEYRVNEMYRYIARKIYEDARELNKPRPNFQGKDIRAEVERAMGGQLAA